MRMLLTVLVLALCGICSLHAGEGGGPVFPPAPPLAPGEQYGQTILSPDGKSISREIIYYCWNMKFSKWIYDYVSNPDKPTRPTITDKYCKPCIDSGTNMITGGTENKTKPTQCGTTSFIDNIFANHHHIATD